MRQLRILLSANVAMWIVYALMWVYGTGEDWISFVALPAGVRELAARPWVAVSYMFAHVSPFHLAVNLLFLLYFGLVAVRNGAGRTLPVLYLAGGICGALLYAAYGDGIMMGASAAVMAVATGTGFRFARYRAVIFGKTFPQTGRIAAAAVIVTLAGAENWATLAAHAGGAMAGYLFLFLHPGVKSPSSVVIDKYSLRNSRTGASPVAQGDVDSILTKARISGFDSLTSDERRLIADCLPEKDRNT